MSSKSTLYKRLIVRKLTSNFRDAVDVEISEICHPPKGSVCVKNKYVGINAADVNISKGRYFVSGQPPFGVGFEAVGEIVDVGEDVENLKVGQCVGYLDTKCSAYAEYTCVETEKLFVIPDATPSYLVLLVAGLTASIGLDKLAKIKAGETVLITAAAGGVGHIAVQWAKAAGGRIIATCSTEEKEKFIKDFGCERIINYKKENLADVLAKEYPKGIDVVWETIGGKVFEDCIKHVATEGRFLVVGGISGYKTEEKEGFPKINLPSLPEHLILKSAAVIGYLITTFPHCFASYFKTMSESFESGKLQVFIDNGEESTGSEFFGMEGIIRGVEHLHSAKSVGKVIARLY